MLTTSSNTLKNRGQKIIKYQSKTKIKALGIKLEHSKVEAGSGSLPEEKIDSIALSFEPKKMTVSKLSYLFY